MIPDGYKFQYTWWMDFTIADAFGLNAIQDTYNRGLNEYHTNRVAMQELTAVLNWKGWQFYEQDNDSEIAKLYFKLNQECYDKCLDFFKGSELTAYWSFLDQQKVSII